MAQPGCKMVRISRIFFVTNQTAVYKSGIAFVFNPSSSSTCSSTLAMHRLSHSSSRALRRAAARASKPSLTRGAHKEIKFSNEGRASILAGVDVLANAVSVTLGPKGRLMFFLKLKLFVTWLHCRAECHYWTVIWWSENYQGWVFRRMQTFIPLYMRRHF